MDLCCCRHRRDQVPPTLELLDGPRREALASKPDWLEQAWLVAATFGTLRLSTPVARRGYFCPSSGSRENQGQCPHGAEKVRAHIRGERMACPALNVVSSTNLLMRSNRAGGQHGARIAVAGGDRPCARDGRSRIDFVCMGVDVFEDVVRSFFIASAYASTQVFRKLGFGRKGAQNEPRLPHCLPAGQSRAARKSCWFGLL